MKNEKKQQGVKNNFFDIYEDTVIEKAKKQENVKKLEEILVIAKESTSLEDFINKIQGMIDSENN